MSTFPRGQHCSLLAEFFKVSQTLPFHNIGSVQHQQSSNSGGYLKIQLYSYQLPFLQKVMPPISTTPSSCIPWDICFRGTRFKRRDTPLIWWHEINCIFCNTTDAKNTFRCVFEWRQAEHQNASSVHRFQVRDTELSALGEPQLLLHPSSLPSTAHSLPTAKILPESEETPNLANLRAEAQKQEQGHVRQLMKRLHAGLKENGANHTSTENPISLLCQELFLLCHVDCDLHRMLRISSSAFFGTWMDFPRGLLSSQSHWS